MRKRKKSDVYVRFCHICIPFLAGGKNVVVFPIFIMVSANSGCLFDTVSQNFTTKAKKFFPSQKKIKLNDIPMNVCLYVFIKKVFMRKIFDKNYFLFHLLSMALPSFIPYFEMCAIIEFLLSGSPSRRRFS